MASPADSWLIEISVGADNPPWGQTFRFFSDVYAVLRATWLERVEGINDYVFDVTSFENGSKKVSGRLRKRKRQRTSSGPGAIPADRIEFRAAPPSETTTRSRLQITPGQALLAGATVLAAIIQPIATAIVSRPPDLVVPQIAPPDLHPQRLQRLEQFIRLHAHGVRITVTDSTGSSVVFEIEDVSLAIGEGHPKRP